VRYARERAREPSRLALLVYLAEAAEAARPRLIFPTQPEEVDAEVWLTPQEVDAKEDCLRLHDAIVTLRDPGQTGRIQRPGVERYDFLDETCSPPVDDLFARL
jgi:hypothetical protein